MVNFLIVGAN